MKLTDAHPPRGLSPRRRSILAVGVMLAAVLVVYYRPSGIWGNEQYFGGDYLYLHQRRIEFARNAIFKDHYLPAWYPREALGTPFWANIQNFPWVPTRLVLLLFEPANAYGVGINLAAILASVFTYLYCRKVGLGMVASATAGWTFACSGFFASRVYVGHLPLLEAYPALPLLLLLVEKCGEQNRRRWILALGICAAFTALCGHPQLPVYALIAAAIYAVVRFPSGRCVRIVGALVSGAAVAAFALWPMWLLIQRSTRILSLDPPDNDVAFPYRRVLAFLFPWRDGWPMAFNPPTHPLVYPNEAYFGDSVCYVGWLPIMAIMFLLLRGIARKRFPPPPFLFLSVIGILAVITAFPWLWNLIGATHVILRSPARQIYLTTFALAVGAGAGIHLLMKLRPQMLALVVLLLLGHGLDLGFHDHYFVQTGQQQAVPTDEQLAKFGAMVGDGRVGFDFSLRVPMNREFDDVGFFDSLVLARPYRAILDLGQLPPRENVEFLSGIDLPKRALRALGVKLVETTTRIVGFPSGGLSLQESHIDGSSPRAQFFAPMSVLYLSTEEMHQRLRDPEFDVQHSLMLPPADHGPVHRLSADDTVVEYHRDSSDAMTIHMQTSQAGYLRILEAWDPGWHATVNGSPAPVALADDVFMAIALPQGDTTVHLQYSTPGRIVGLWISAGALVALLGISFCGKRAVR